MSTSRSAGGGVPAGGGGLDVESYVAFLRSEYLDDYVRSGGAAVKMVVAGGDEVAERFSSRLTAAATEAGYRVCTLDSAEIRMPLVDQIFLAVSRELDWNSVAGEMTRRAYDAADLPAGDDLSVSQVALLHGVDERELYRSVRRQLEQSLLTDDQLPRELRLAVLRLAQFPLGRGDVDTDERGAVLSWLRGETVPLARLRSSGIYARISRSTARPLLVALPRLLMRGGAAGLVLLLNLARLAEARRPPLEQRCGHYYSKAAVLDIYEVLRQLIDATDDLSGLVVVAVVPPELVTDEVRGLPAYSALQLRVADEVRDRRRANPYAALVRLEVRLEAVP